MLSQQINKKRPNTYQKTPLKSAPQLGSILGPTWLHLGMVLGAKMGPSWYPIAEKSISKSIKKLITFRIALGTDFERFWAPTWHQLGPQDGLMNRLRGRLRGPGSLLDRSHT